MSEAKECDRCKSFFKTEGLDAMPYHIKATDSQNRDLCSACLYELEEWMDNPKKVGKKVKRTANWSEEKLEAASQRMQGRQEIAKLIQKGSGIPWSEAVQKAAMRVQKAKAEGVSMDDLIASIKKSKESKTPICSMCGQNKVKTEGDMCGKCISDWNEFKREK
jgi:hypothetical protein